MIQHKMVLAEKIVDKIINELCDRNGFDHWWYDIDIDIRDEIRETLAQIVKKSMENENE